MFDFSTIPCFSGDAKFLTPDGWRTFFSTITDQALSKKLNGTMEVLCTCEKQDICFVMTVCGRSIKCSKNYSFNTKRGMIKADDLNTDDNISISLPKEHVPQKKNTNYDLGLIAGLIVGAGHVHKENVYINLWTSNPDLPNEIQSIIHRILKLKSLVKINDKNLPKFQQTKSIIESRLSRLYQFSSIDLFEILNGIRFSRESLEWIHEQDKEFKSGFLSAIFYTQSEVNIDSASRLISIGFSYNDFKFLQNAQLICQELGIPAQISSKNNRAINTLIIDDIKLFNTFEADKEFRQPGFGYAKIAFVDRIGKEYTYYLCDKNSQPLTDYQNIGLEI